MPKDTESKTPAEGAGKTLWTASAGGPTSIGDLAPPTNLADLARTAAEEAEREAEVRLRPYRTPVTTETLRTPTS